MAHVNALQQVQESAAQQAWLDVRVDEGVAPVDAARAIQLAGIYGCRQVTVPSALAKAARKTLGRTVKLAVSCSDVLGWPGDSLLMHAHAKLTGVHVDELVIPVDANLLADAAWTRKQLHRVASLCHAHGALAVVRLSADGISAAHMRVLAQGMREASIDAVILAPERKAVPADVLMAALTAAAPRTAVRVEEPASTPERTIQLQDLGAESQVLTAQAFLALAAEAKQVA